MVITKNADGTYTFQFTADEQTVVDDVETEYGLTVLNTLISQWLETHREAFADIKRRTFEQQLNTLPPGKQIQVRDILEGRA